MSKTIVTFKLTDDNLSFLNYIAERNKVSRTIVNEVFISMIRDYFSEEQIDGEVAAREIIDRRTKKFRSMENV